MGILTFLDCWTLKGDFVFALIDRNVANNGGGVDVACPSKVAGDVKGNFQEMNIVYEYVVRELYQSHLFETGYYKN